MYETAAQTPCKTRVEFTSLAVEISQVTVTAGLVDTDLLSIRRLLPLLRLCVNLRDTFMPYTPRAAPSFLLKSAESCFLMLAACFRLRQIFVRNSLTLHRPTVRSHSYDAVLRQTGQTYLAKVPQSSFRVSLRSARISTLLYSADT